MNEAKPFLISKREVWEAYRKVKANRGAAGVDAQSIADFDRGLKNNLYKLWNRMSSGSYFPPPVRMVKIPKADGSERRLGIPTVADRIAQTVVKAKLEPQIEPLFHPNSFGYRPGRSALDAVGQARQNCWDYDWVLDLDVRGFFDNIDWELLMKAVKKHAPEPWVVLYVERWLKVPAHEQDGRVVERTSGTPQGGVISPLLANLFLHYAFDVCMGRQFPQLPFERYADDAIVHCRTRREAEEVWTALAKRLAQCRLELHSKKTKIVYCKNERRRGNYSIQKFDFLGYTFRPRGSKNWRGEIFVGFNPAISNYAAKAIRDAIRGWRLQSCSHKSIQDLSRMYNPTFVAGSTIMGGITARKLIGRCVNWTKRWRVGRRGNTRNCAVVPGARHGGSPGFLGTIRRCLRTGRWCGEVPLWEPYEWRRSRPVLGEVRGEIPRAYSTLPT